MKSPVPTQNPTPRPSPSGGGPNPLWVGLRAAKANLVPGLIVQAAVMALVAGYYWHEPTRLWLARLAEAKSRGGYGFSFLAGGVAGGVFPEILAVAVFARGRVTRENWGRLVFHFLFWGVDAVVVDAFYRSQAWAFGSQIDFATVAKKVLIDQFVYNPLVAAPFLLVTFEWRGQGYRFRGLSRVWTAAFYREKVFPMLVATWGVWIPVVTMVYSLPPLLQIPLFSLALTFWVMLVMWIDNTHRQGKAD